MSARCVDAPELAPDVSWDTDAASASTWRDRIGRVIAPIYVNGEGPFRFLVDTGANRSGLSRRLTETLAIVPIGEGEVHSVINARMAPLAPPQSLSFEGVALDSGVMPVLDADVLGEASGLLGVDAMNGRRLLIDFENRCIEIRSSRGARRLRDWTRVRGRLGFGNLVVIEGAIDDVRVQMFLDTGSASTLANVALYEALSDRVRRRVERGVIGYTAGGPIVFDAAVHLPRVQMGSMEIEHVTAFVGAFHIFEVWRLSDQPALLIGMDVLSQARGLAIDYAEANVYFRGDADASINLTPLSGRLMN